MNHQTHSLAEPGVDFSDWFKYCGDCCTSCGNRKAELLLIDAGWQDVICDNCIDMAGKVYRP